MRQLCSMTVTDGQIALGQINLFHDKLYWGSADIVIRADNSLRPSAAIGGVVNLPVDDSLEMKLKANRPMKTHMLRAKSGWGRHRIVRREHR